MLSLNRKTHYAMVAMVDLARRSPVRVRAREIGQRFRLPLPALTNILNHLTRKGLIASTRGSKGGYSLTRDPGEITMADLIEAVEGPVRLTDCCPTVSGAPERGCGREDLCPVSPSVKKVNEVFERFLNRVTLDHIMRGCLPPGVEWPDEVGSEGGPPDNTPRAPAV